MSTIAIGDIHGNLAALLDLLGQLSAEVGRGDVVVFLGDYIDRGLFFSNDDGFYSHAGLDPCVTNVTEQTSEALVWGHPRFPTEYRGDQIVVYGHWNNPDFEVNGWPTARIWGNTIGIDTIAHGVLTAIRLPDRRIFQSARHVVTGLAF
jgi:calcineurin-like phosphoesterase family protein